MSSMELSKLKEPLDSYHWRIGQVIKNDTQARMLAYVDARQVMDRLDEVCTPGNWQDDYKEVKGKLLAGIGIKVDSNWVWKWDTGDESNMEGSKGENSDSFKRAAVKWGVGRFLYDLGTLIVNVKPAGKSHRVCDKDGNILWDQKEVDEYCQKLYNYYHKQQ